MSSFPTCSPACAACSSSEFQSAVAHELISNEGGIPPSSRKARAFQSAVAHELISNQRLAATNAAIAFQSAVAHELISNLVGFALVGLVVYVSKRCRA